MVHQPRQSIRVAWSSRWKGELSRVCADAERKERRLRLTQHHPTWRLRLGPSCLRRVVRPLLGCLRGVPGLVQRTQLLY
eukprot:257824-Prymnesium_polylepis.1